MLETLLITRGSDLQRQRITGTQFTNTSATVGNDISTLPDFPAEIRAPAGSLPGVSGFQLNFSSKDIKTPGDQPNVLVAMNPAPAKRMVTVSSSSRCFSACSTGGSITVLMSV